MDTLQSYYDEPAAQARFQPNIPKRTETHEGRNRQFPNTKQGRPAKSRALLTLRSALANPRVPVDHSRAGFHALVVDHLDD